MVDFNNILVLSMSGYLVWFEGRNTAKAVAAKSRPEAVKKAKASGAAGSDGKVVKARKANEQEQRKLNKGVWVRTRPDGSNPTGGKDSKKKASKFKSKFRSGPSKQSKAR